MTKLTQNIQDLLKSTSIWDIAEKTSYLLTIIGIPYLLIDKIKKLPKFSFGFSGQSGTGFRKNDKEWYKFTFSGDIKNHSLEPNTIQRIFLVVWRNKQKTDTKRFGHGTLQIKDLTGKTYNEPLLFAPKESKKLTITYESQIEDTIDKKILSDLIPIFPGKPYYMHRDQYELAFEDINGNLFDQKGVLLSRKLIDLNWTIENTFKDLRDSKFIPFITHKLKVFYETVKWRIKQFLRLLGL